MFGFKKQHTAIVKTSNSSGRKTGSARNQVTITGGGVGGAKSLNGLSGDGLPLRINSRRMTLNARRAMYDSLEARSIVDRNADIVTDTGIMVEPTVNASILGITPEEADAFNEKIRDKYHLFMNSKQCHRSRKMTGYDATRLYNKSMLTDNDQFVRFYFDKESDAQSTVSFEFIDPLHVAGDGITSTDGTLSVRDGIEYDSKGREVSYLINRPLPNGEFESIRVPAKRAGRIFMVHGFIADLISQMRGYSQIGHALDEFQKLGDFTQAHIQKAITQASMAIAIENTGDTDPSDPFAGMLTPAGMDSGYQMGSEGSSDLGREDTLSINRVNDFVTGANGSLAIVNLRAKDKIHAIENTAPVTGYDVFTDSFTSHLAASVRMPVEVLLQKFNSNYSASRAALLLFYRVAQIYRQKIDSDFLTPLYENWFAEEIASGEFVCPGFSDPVIKAAWLSHGLVSAPVPNIDPLKSAIAKEKELQLSLTTHDRASHETNGSNGKANRAANARVFGEMPVPYWAQKQAVGK